MINFQVYKSGVSIDCDYDYEASKILDFNTLIIFHGLFGRGKNWQTFSKLLTKNTDLIVITVDLRNHGGNVFKRNH